MKKNKLYLLGIIAILCLFTSCGDDDDRGRYVGYDDHDNEWGKSDTRSVGINDTTFIYNSNQNEK